MQITNLTVLQSAQNESHLAQSLEKKLSLPPAAHAVSKAPLYNPTARNDMNTPIEIPADSFNMGLTLSEFPEDNNLWVRFTADNIKKITVKGEFAEEANFYTRVYKLDAENSTLHQIVESNNIFATHDEVGFLPENGFYYYVNFELITGSHVFQLYIQTSTATGSKEPNDSIMQATACPSGEIRYRDTFDGLYDFDWIKFDIPIGASYRFDFTFNQTTLATPFTLICLKKTSTNLIPIATLENLTTPCYNASISPNVFMEAGTYYICLRQTNATPILNQEYEFFLRPIKYYYKKYRIDTKTIYRKDSSWTPIKGSMVFYKNKNALTLAESNVVFNELTGMYTIPHGTQLINWGTLGFSAPVYLTSSIIDKPGDTLYRTNSEGHKESFTGTNVSYKKSRSIDQEIKTEIGTITADENAYPYNGKASDGYWYVRGDRCPDTPVQYHYNKYALAKGAFIETISGTATQYPTNGYQGNYWYERTGLV